MEVSPTQLHVITVLAEGGTLYAFWEGDMHKQYAFNDKEGNQYRILELTICALKRKKLLLELTDRQAMGVNSFLLTPLGKLYEERLNKKHLLNL